MTSHGVHWRLAIGQRGYIAVVDANQLANRPAVIDVHAHVHHESVIRKREAFASQDAWFGVQNPPGSRRLSTVSRLVAQMDAGGIDVSWALGFGWRDHGLAVDQNDLIREASRGHENRIRLFGSANPAAGLAAIREVERLASRGFSGIGELFPDGQGFDLTDRETMAPFLEVCEATRMAIVVHASEPVGRDYAGRDHTTPDRVLQLIDLAAEVAPKVTLIFGHLGGGLPLYAHMPDVRRRIERARVWFDTAACRFLWDPSVLAEASRLCPGRILFGSDHPVGGIGAMRRWVDDANLVPEVRGGVMGLDAPDLRLNE